jgi:hypothetical protein
MELSFVKPLLFLVFKSGKEKKAKVRLQFSGKLWFPTSTFSHTRQFDVSKER